MRVAMYLRLSCEDGDLKDTGKAESESISNQREPIREPTTERTSNAELTQNSVIGCVQATISKSRFSIRSSCRIFEQRSAW